MLGIITCFILFLNSTACEVWNCCVKAETRNMKPCWTFLGIVLCLRGNQGAFQSHSGAFLSSQTPFSHRGGNRAKNFHLFRHRQFAYLLGNIFKGKTWLGLLMRTTPTQNCTSTKYRSSVRDTCIYRNNSSFFIYALTLSIKKQFQGYLPIKTFIAIKLNNLLLLF